MTPEGRLQGLIDLMEEVGKGGAADAAASAFFRARRYIGAKDRSWIAERLYQLLRRRARLDWWIDRVLERPEGGPKPVARHRVIADLLLAEQWPADRLIRAFDGERYNPAPLSRAENRLVEMLAGQPLEHPDQPDWVKRELPEWLAGELERLFDGDLAELAALNEAAPLDLRVNLLVGDRDAAQAALAAVGIESAPTAFSPLCLRVTGRPSLGKQPLFQAGQVEVQDEGSQLVALLADARPGQAVLDYCAGAGGKTLALAAQMKNKGRLIACDISAVRLERAVTRLRRAGVHNVERRALGADASQWLKRQAGRFDRVLVDAPCSGTGTWRRNPDMKWKIGPRDLAELTVLQGEILATASRLVKPGGRLVYATCSLLPVENEATVEAFLAQHPDFEVRPVPDIWADAVGGACPVPGPYLRLTPARHGTDGFFAAVLERRAVVVEAA